MKGRKNIHIAISLIPAITVYLIVVIYPALKVFTSSVYKWSGLSSEKTFIGLDNFKRLIADDKFWVALENTVVILIGCTIVTMCIALFFSAILTLGNLKEKNFYRIIFFFPSVLSTVVIGTLFRNIYEPSTGILNAFLNKIGLGGMTHAWLGESKTVIGAVIVAMVWQAVGYYMIIYMGGMQEISTELYETAEIDGASKGKQFMYITIPMIRKIIRISMVCFIISVLNMSFLFVSIMTNGGPNGSSEVLLTYMYKQAFTYANFGYAMAIAVVIFLLAMILALLSYALTYKKDDN